jgi:hypothetical protein
MNARTAAELSVSASSSEVDEILDLIEIEAKKKNTKLYLNSYPSGGAIKALKDLGFNIYTSSHSIGYKVMYYIQW